MNAESKFITIPGNPGEVLQSQHGNTTYLAWCQMEVARINKSGGNVKLFFDVEYKTCAVQRA